MQEKPLQQVLAEFPLFEGLSPDQLEVVAGCGENLYFREGERIIREGDPARKFYVIRRGRVSLELPVPGREALLIQALGEGEVLGWSWLFPPYRWEIDGRALEPTRVSALDGDCLRRKCDADPELGYRVMRQFARIVVERLHALRLQLLECQSED